MTQPEKIKVAFLASEADPIVKVGGLADVAGSLPRALNHLSPIYTKGRGLDVRLFLPFHGFLLKKIAPLKVDEFSISTTTGILPVKVYKLELNQVTTYLFAGQLFGENDPVYTADNRIDGEKYTFFTVAAIEFIQRMHWKPDILHANDWHTAPGVHLLAKKRKKSMFFAGTRTVLSVHNLPYMGGGAEAALKHYRIPTSRNPLLPGWANKQPLPLGLQSADQVIAVSPGYAQEILTPEFGCTLEKYLVTRKDSISGIVNGLDMDSWNPATDQALVERFSINTLANRIRNKHALLNTLALSAQPDLPLLIFISRMDNQKGIDLVLDALKYILHIHWNVVLLGTGNPDLMRACQDFQTAYPERVRAELRFDASLARQMYAGGDMLLMPSRYEPCGLAQMIAMRYGCIPIARATGGLKDTIIDQADSQRGTGFLFEGASGKALAETIERALGFYQDHLVWKEIQQRGMQTDFSWQNSAIKYAQTYLTLMEKPL